MSPRRERSGCRRQRPSSATGPSIPRPTAGCCCRATIARATTRTPGGWTRKCSKACSSGRWLLNVLSKASVEIRPAVAKEAEGGAVFFGRGEVELGDQGAAFLGPKLSEDVAAFVAD